MDSKITLSFDADVIQRAKVLADELGISLSRLTEILYTKALQHGDPYKIEDYPVSDWVMMVAEDNVEYVKTPKSRSDLKKEYAESRK